jgi:hypothetical protein
MPTLLLTPRHTEDSQQLWRGCLRLGWGVERVHGWKVPDLSPDEAVVYAEPLLAKRIAGGLNLELLEPPLDWLPAIPERWRKREVQLATMREARAVREARFVKSAAGKEFDARVYASGSELPNGQMIDDSLPVLIQEIVQFDVEYRCFVSERTVRAASSYWRFGKEPRSESGVWVADELPEAIEFCNALLADADVQVSGACVIDVGIINGRGWGVIECNAAWSSGIYGCEGTAVLPVLQAACRSRR